MLLDTRCTWLCCEETALTLWMILATVFFCHMFLILVAETKSPKEEQAALTHIRRKSVDYDEMPANVWVSLIKNFSFK